MMKRFSFKFLVLALCVALLPTARASVHEADHDIQDFIKLLAQHNAAPQSSSRKLLGGTECFSKITLTADAYVGSCDALTVKDESHWCDTDDVTSSGLTAYGFSSADIAEFQTALALIGNPDSFCIGESSDDCCTSAKDTGASLGSGSGVSRLSRAFAFTALVGSALAIV